MYTLPSTPRPGDDVKKLLAVYECSTVPSVPSNAYSVRLAREAMYSTPAGLKAGDVTIELDTPTDHINEPVDAETAYTFESAEPMYTSPFPIAGTAGMAPFVLKLQRAATLGPGGLAKADMPVC